MLYIRHALYWNSFLALGVVFSVSGSYKISWHNIYCSKYGIFFIKLQFPLGMSYCIYINALLQLNRANI